MNKKVVLSVLSATFVASMAASAFAAPKDGLYIGGNVQKHYSFKTLLDLDAAGKAKFNADLAANGANFNNLVFVDLDGKGASISEILDEGLDEAKKEALVDADFADSYSTIGTDGSVTGTYDPTNDLPDAPAGDLKVESVSAISKTT
ncbi:hypothetical protein ABES19_02425, partial [Brevibacillus choshinensis]